jgi:rare lipoprotein A
MHVHLTARLFCALLIVGAATCGSAPRVEPAMVPASDTVSTGTASWYGPGFDGKTTASGEKFNQNHLTAAHRTLPFGTMVRVKCLKNGRTVDVRINDRGPFTKGRIIDLSKAAAREIGLVERGIGPVEIRVLSLPAR